jgi:hypothetical protein
MKINRYDRVENVQSTGRVAEDGLPEILQLMSKVKEARERLKKSGEQYHQKLSLTNHSRPDDSLAREWQDIPSPCISPPPKYLFPGYILAGEVPSQKLTDGDDSVFVDQDLGVQEGEIIFNRNREDGFQDEDLDIATQDKSTRRVWPWRIMALVMVVVVLTFVSIR